MGSYRHNYTMVVGMLLLCLLVMASFVNEVKADDDAKGRGKVESSGKAVSSSQSASSSGKAESSSQSASDQSLGNASNQSSGKATSQSSAGNAGSSNQTSGNAKSADQGNAKKSDPGKEEEKPLLPGQKGKSGNKLTCFQPCMAKCMDQRGPLACREACHGQCG